VVDTAISGGPVQLRLRVWRSFCDIGHFNVRPDGTVNQSSAATRPSRTIRTASTWRRALAKAAAAQTDAAEETAATLQTAARAQVPPVCRGAMHSCYVTAIWCVSS
jgi:hypothetical protein